MEDYYKIILTSSVVAATISTIISGFIAFVSIRLKHRNDYYQKIIDKRLEAYDFINNQLSLLKFTGFDEKDKKFFYVMFNQSQNDILEFQNNLIQAFSKSFWIDKETIKNMEKLNQVFYLINNEITENIENNCNVGKKYYNRIANIKNKLEESINKDLSNMFKFCFLLRKRFNNGKRLFYSNSQK